MAGTICPRILKSLKMKNLHRQPFLCSFFQSSLACRHEKKKMAGRASFSWSTFMPLEIFYRIIHPEYIQNRNLRLPSQFSPEFGTELSRTATVVSPASGGDWEIRVKKVSEEDIFLEKDWGEFMEAHAIGVWYLVVFEYLGDSMFRVVQIFDRTTRACLHGSGDEHSTDNNNNQQQQEAEAEKEEEQTHLINEPEGDEMEAVISTLATKGAHVIETISSKTSTASGILTSESNRLLEMNANKLQNPCFLVAIHQFDRVVTSGSEGEDELLGELWDGGRGKWKVQIYANSSGCVHLRKGWCELYRDNSLKEGDICLFELTGAKPVVLKASIFRVSPQ